jgi:hypothetical protein
MFCASATAVATMGLVAQSKEHKEQRAAQQTGQPTPRPKLPAGKVTIVVVAGLLVASALYHSQGLG